MNTSQPHSALFTPLAWDPGLLPPLEMDGYLTGVLVTPELEIADWIADLWTALPGDGSSQNGAGPRRRSDTVQGD
ncbi:hypothetical protein ACFSHP_20455 [Novosphingobium panipatense]